MGDFKTRYLNRKKLTLHCKTVTPLFLGNANQEAEWRSAPFKGLLRYWWRVTQHEKTDVESLLSAESELFGAAGETGNDDKNSGIGKSLIQVIVQSQATPKPANETFGIQKIVNIHHPEKGNVNPLLYLAGMGLMKNEKTTHSYFPVQSPFIMSFDYPEAIEEILKPAFILLYAFGSIGSRSRNGWGSYMIQSSAPEMIKPEEFLPTLNRITKKWQAGFNKDYPNCLGEDGGKLLMWKTESKPSWHEAMGSLAQVYAQVRAGTINGIGKLHPGMNNQPNERHLLGVPLTHHNAWGSNARHASPLRLIIRQKSNNFQGFILHLPFRFSDEMKFASDQDKNWQIGVWKKVHKKLDGLLPRATYKECL